MSESGEKTLDARARIRLGSTLKGKYTLEELLGLGGMAAVYGATHRNRRRFAVKMLHAELSVHDDLRTRFLREGYVANSVAHPGAVAVLDDDVSDDGAAFLVMELLEGETVEELRRRLGSVPLPIVLGIADRLLEVLMAAHARAIVHRDIKPANLFVTREGQLKVLDFGVARLRDTTGDGATYSGLALGTPAFMAPEQALGRADVDARADLWSVAATMFTLLSGRFVHGAPSAQEAMIWAATRPAPSLASVCPHVPAQVAEIVDRGLAFEQDRRWQTAGKMRDAIRSAFESIEEEPPPSDVLASIWVHRSSMRRLSDHDPTAPTRHGEQVAAHREAPAASAEPTLNPVVARSSTMASRRNAILGGVGTLIAVAVVVVAVRAALHVERDGRSSTEAAEAPAYTTLHTSTPSATASDVEPHASPAPSTNAAAPAPSSSPAPAGSPARESAAPPKVHARVPAPRTKPVVGDHGAPILDPE